MAVKTIVLFEDLLWFHFYPFSLLRPVFDLRVGIFSPYEKIRRLYPAAEVKLICRPELEDLVQADGRTLFRDEDFATCEQCLFVNARALFRGRHRFDPDTILLEDEDLVYLFPGPGRLNDWKMRDFLDGEAPLRARALGLRTKEMEHRMLRFPWDIVEWCGQEIVHDRSLLDWPKKATGGIRPGAHVLGKRDLVCGTGAVVEAGAVVDARSGPVVLASGARITPHSHVVGPAWIGQDSIVQRAFINGGVSIGASCCVGGEVEHSLIHDHSKKEHNGYLGYSCLGSWVLMGPQASCSALRNDVREISVSLEGRLVRSGRTQLGCLIGDYSRIGLGVMLNPGTVVGSCSNIYNQRRMVRKEIPSFVYGGRRPFREYALNSLLDTLHAIMEQSGAALDDGPRRRILRMFSETATFRTKFLRRED